MMPSTTLFFFVFQSAPLTKARGDIKVCKRSTKDGRFNPLPSQKQGETSSVLLNSSNGLSFNPLPSQKQGETPHISCSVSVCSVSIRSPHKSKGRPATFDVDVPSDEFQSAPLTKARGDQFLLVRFRLISSFNPLPSQKQGETRTTKRHPKRKIVSIRSPHKSKGRRYYF